MSALLNQTNLNIQGAILNSSVLDTEIERKVPEFIGPVVLQVSHAAGSAGADVGPIAFYRVPTGKVLTINKATLIPTGSSAGIDDSNTLVVQIHNTAQTPVLIAAKTWDADPAYPAVNVPVDLTLTDYVVLPAGTILTSTVTQGNTADHNGILLLVEGMLLNA